MQHRPVLLHYQEITGLYTFTANHKGHQALSAADILVILARHGSRAFGHPVVSVNQIQGPTHKVQIEYRVDMDAPISQQNTQERKIRIW